jgi:hypothetical protein
MDNEILKTGYISKEIDAVHKTMLINHALCDLITEYKTLTGNKFSDRDVMMAKTPESDALRAELSALLNTTILDVWYVHADNWCKCLLEQVQPEVAIAVLGSAVSVSILPFNNTKMPHHKEFFNKNAHMFIDIHSV